MAANGDATGTESAIEETSEYTTQHPTSSQTHVPSAAKWLGALGAIPFVSLAVADYFLEGPFQEQVSFALAAYQPVDEVGSGRWLTGLIHCRRGLWEIGDGDGSAG